jgi:uncharacterized protein
VRRPHTGGRLRHVLDRDRQELVCESCLLADTPTARLRGLLGRRELPPGEGVLLRPSGAVHTCFMRFSIDVAFLDSDLVVVEVVHRLRPWRLAARRGARAVLELAAGEAERRRIGVGSRLAIADPKTS